MIRGWLSHIFKTTGMASHKKAKQGLFERLKQWCMASMCYCYSINKIISPGEWIFAYYCYTHLTCTCTYTTDPGDIQLPSTERSESHDSHMTDQSESGLSQVSSQSRRNSKSVTWQSSRRSSEEGVTTSLPTSLLSGTYTRKCKSLKCTLKRVYTSLWIQNKTKKKSVGHTIHTNNHWVATKC